LRQALEDARMSEHGNDIYNLKIDAYTPETIPMARLAEYLSALAELLGEEHCVHFQSVVPGSTQLTCAVEREATYKVAKRVESVASANANTPLGRAYRGIRRLLREDSAGGTTELQRAKCPDFSWCSATGEQRCRAILAKYFPRWRLGADWWTRRHGACGTAKQRRNALELCRESRAGQATGQLSVRATDPHDRQREAPAG